MSDVLVIGTYVSPYVRKVLVSLAVKNIAYRIDPIVPFFGNDEFTRLSPVRRIPVLVDGDTTLCDSTVICEYLEDRYGGPSLFPGAATDIARARWLEEYADTRMGEVLIWQLFNQAVIRPRVWRQPTDPAILERARDTAIPEILDYLEGQMPSSGYLFDSLSVADIAIASLFRNAALAGYDIDPSRWPVTAGYVARVLGEPAFVSLAPFEELSLCTPIPEQRDALRAAGAPVSAQTLGGSRPRRGIMGT